METAVEAPVPADRQSVEPTLPVEPADPAPVSQNAIVPPSESQAEVGQSETTESEAPDRPAVPENTSTTDGTPSNPAQTTDAMDTTSDPSAQSSTTEAANAAPDATAMDVEPTTDATASQEPTTNAEDQGDSASPGDSSAAESTRPTSESEDSTVSAGEEDGREDSQEEKSEEEPAYWADIVEDTSVPDEAELKDIEAADADYSAYEYNYWENTFYRDPEDPEYRPSEKARLTWKIKGIRGTKDQPNRATIMRSPAAYIGGHYWTIKFFPRGNSVSSLSIYVECSATPPKQDKDIPETEFRVLRGAPDADLSKLDPETELQLPATPIFKQPEQPKSSENEDKKDEANVETSEVAGQSTPPETKTEEKKKDWRVSAQIGVILYNPDEPRTGWMQSSCHQFNPHNVDWGWTHFHGPWDQIHKRHHGQRQALLRNDTLAFDAYIRIFDDPTQSLWWHASDTEPIWDSLSVTGYRPLGDPMVNYSHEVAGLASWLLMASFREIIQEVDILEHLTNPEIKPRPLCDALQRLLWALRNQKATSQLFIDTDQVTTTLRNLHEFSGDVNEFWERLRRTLELELAGTQAGAKLAKIFDSPRIENAGEMVDDSTTINYLPKESNGKIRFSVSEADSIEQGTKSVLDEQSGKWSLPSVLTVDLARQTFDKSARQWNMLYDKVKLNETLDLSDRVVEGQSGKYHLYSVIVHKGNRSSGRFYSICRPGGPNTRWLAFEDAADNKVECLTTKAALLNHEGLPAEEAKKVDKAGIDVAAGAVYVRDDAISEYLTGKIEPWEPPQLCEHYFRTGYYRLGRNEDGSPPDIKVELYDLPGFDMIEKSIIDSYDIMSTARAMGRCDTLYIPGNTTFMGLRKHIAELKSTDEVTLDPQRVRVWQLGARKPLFAPTLNFQIIDDYYDSITSFELDTLRLWVHVLSEENARFFAIPDLTDVPAVKAADPVTTEDPQDILPNSHDEPIETADAEMSDAPAEEDQDPPSQATEQPADQPNEQPTEQPTEQPAEPEAEPATEPAVEQAPSPTADETHPLENATLEQADTPMHDADNPEPEAPLDPIENPYPHPPMTRPESREGDREPTEDEVAPQTNATQDNDVTMEDSPPAAEETEAAEEAAPTSELVPLSAQVYYFIQKFDAEKQCLKTIGTFFAKKSEAIKDSVRTALGYASDKPFLLWHRVDGISIVAVSSVERFETVVGYTDGECFVVGDIIGKNERMKHAEQGLFSSPDRLVPYLWAMSRNHPTKSFTGKKTTEATYNGDYYSGDYKNGYFHGKGTHISESGATYEGDFILGERQGYGTMEYATGDTYTGDWMEDQCHGQGTHVERKTGNKYVGGYRNGKRHGKGISYWEVADEEMDLCQICYSENQDSLFYSCGHVCACLSCARQVDICPMCRKKVLNVVKIYKS